MGIRASGLQVLSKMLPAKRVLSLGYPDILATKEDVIRIFGVEPELFVNTGKWHGVNYPLPETIALFQQFGCELVCVDVHASRGVERIVDLNQPATLGKYDIVLDLGTTEHCFNIGQALKNAVDAIDVGGRIFHTSPVTMINHGFYNLNPTFFADFYTQNGFELELFVGCVNETFFEVPAFDRVSLPNEASLYVVARKSSDTTIQWPTQQKYLRNPDLKAP